MPWKRRRASSRRSLPNSLRTWRRPFNHQEAIISWTANTLGVLKSKTGARWWVLASSSALLITALVLAVVYLITKKPSVIDQVVIVTVPSGAEIRLNAKSYGNSPVKLEQVKVGTYTLTISKEGYETIEEQVNIAETPQLEYTLKHVTPDEAVGRSLEDRISLYQQRATAALASNHYVWPQGDNAIYWVDLIREIDP